MNKQQGFTIVELVAAIVILAILAALAVPKFSDLSAEAKVARLEGMEAAIRSGANIIYAKAVLEERTKGANSIVVDGASIALHSGYPVGNWVQGFRYIVNLDALSFTVVSDVCNVEWCGRGNQTSVPGGKTTTLPGRMGKVFPKGYRWSDECGVYYINHQNGSEPEIGLTADDC